MKKSVLSPAGLPAPCQPAMLSITTEICKERFTSVLREHVGVAKLFSTDAASEALGIDRRTMESYLAGENLPSVRNLLRMFRLFGADFANSVVRLSGLDGCKREDGHACTDFELNADTVRLAAALGAAFRTGTVDHRSKSEVLRAARVLREAIDDYITEKDAIPIRNKQR